MGLTVIDTRAPGKQFRVTRYARDTHRSDEPGLLP
jgi:hypothetical protein